MLGRYLIPLAPFLLIGITSVLVPVLLPLPGA